MYEYQGIAIIPILMMLSQLLKAQGLNTKLIPIINVILGVLCGILLNLNDIFRGVLIGLEISFTAMGLFSGVKNTVQLFKE